MGVALPSSSRSVEYASKQLGKERNQDAVVLVLLMIVGIVFVNACIVFALKYCLLFWRLQVAEYTNDASAEERRNFARRDTRMQRRVLTQNVLECLFPRMTYESYLRAQKKHAELRLHRQQKYGNTNPIILTPTAFNPTITSSNVQQSPAVHFLQSDTEGARRDTTADERKYLVERETTPEEELCVVCLENYQGNDFIRILPCGHIFHAHCLDIWMTRTFANCPLCKADYSMLQHLNVWNQYRNPGESSIRHLYGYRNGTLYFLNSRSRSIV
ncbi:ubiquitin-protein ligase E3 [Schizosaccharomyces japonicus yFS275]|uniref:Ubiquitin-protein ligase E3 n=1 Tax=Schizosaccharomyces japonicus (strain yFS275 / FY16936) TaxID=402676 RepID=B6K839_SCHJY|nr:ubiquitin-protein ligase E3 [Schizosaccharomyces japonicus yFS275]EEB09693.1 ubiquitin-protein ligase E3 [Schizosaccharomyces japonicus yFS275]